MATNTRPVSLAYALLFLAATSLNAQDVPAPVDEDIPPQDSAPSEFIPEGQVVPVATDDVDDGEESGQVMTVPEATDAETLSSQFALFKRLMGERVFDEADTVAKRVVELALKEKGAQSSEFAKALTNLAIVQHHTQQYDSAQQNFETAIEIIEDNEDRLNAQLINPLKGLGASQLESGRPDLAKATFGRAVHVTHVNEGPHNLDQIELLESLAETNLRMGEMDAAKEAQDTIYALNVRKHNIDSMALVPPLMRRAAWQHRAGFIYDERATYRRVVRIIEEAESKDSLKLVEPLIRLGKSFFFIDTSGSDTFAETRVSTGEIYFRRAARITAENPEAGWQVQAQATLALGDYYMYESNPQRARSVYASVWELLSEDEERHGVRREQLESVVSLRESDIPQYVNSADAQGGVQADDDDPLLQGKIAIVYSLSARGRPTDLKLIEAEPPEFADMQRSVQREVRRRLYRLKFQDAEVVDTPDQMLVHNFYYRQSDLDAARAAAEAAQRTN